MNKLTTLLRRDQTSEDSNAFYIRQSTHTKFSDCNIIDNLQWYRLVLNSSLLRAVLSPSVSKKPSLPSWALDPLTISLTAASQILLSISTLSFKSIVNLDCRDSSTVPKHALVIDPEARKSLHHAVDSTWISHTFAITFLVLCYLRNIIDGKRFLEDPKESNC